MAAMDVLVLLVDQVLLMLEGEAADLDIMQQLAREASGD
jgi:hypothetical protein